MSKLILLVCWLCLPVLGLTAESEFAHELDALATELDRHETQFGEQMTSLAELEQSSERLQTVLQRALELRDVAQTEFQALDNLLTTLGPAPEQGQSEAPQVATLRRELEQQRDPYLGQAKKAGIVAARAEQLITDLAQRITERQAQQLLYRSASLSEPAVWQRAGSFLSGSWNIPPEWILALILAIAALLLARYVALHYWRYWRTLPNWQRCIDIAAGAGIRVLLAALLPLLLALAVGLVLDWVLRLTHREVYLVLTACCALTAGLFISDSARAPLPLLRHLGWVLPVLGATLGLSLWLNLAERTLIANLDFYQIIQFILRTLIAILFILLARHGLAMLPEPISSSKRLHSFAKKRRSLKNMLSTAIVITVALFAAANPILLAAGYITLADWLFIGVIGSATLLLGFWLGHRAMLGIGALLARTVLRPLLIIYLQRRYTHRQGRLLQLFFVLIMDVVLLGAFIVILPLLWQIDISGFTLWTYRLFFGVEVGALTLSLFDILAAIVVLFIIIVLTRMIQRLLAQRVFPHTRLDEGARSSLRTGLGYTGFLLAVLLALATLGVQLTQLALILGGLAVGIGFGLQHIANNIVSGIILLVERPIRPGDWITLKDHEGLVDRISLRATEIKTFQHASILIPNAEFISNTVRNWTLRDASGRVDINLTVQRQSDDQTVTNILLQCAQEHPKVLADPPPEVFLKAFTNLGIEYEVWAYTRNIHQTFWISSELRKSVLQRLQQADIGLATEATEPD